MVGDKAMLSNVQKIAPVTIGLPNGAHTIAIEIGLSSLGENLQLENVLYVPNLKCNLVSISKLCKQFNYAVTYFDDFCVIQDCTLRILIGSGEQREEVYYLKQVPTQQVNAMKATDTLQVKFFPIFPVV